MADLVRGPRIEVTFPGGKRVDARLGDHVVHTDQPLKAGGEGTAPSPLDLFFAALATCAGFYVLEFCGGRGIPLAGVRLSQTFDRDPATKRIVAVQLTIHVPPEFPDKYRTAVVQAANSCAVKKLVENAPVMAVQVEVG